MAIGGLIVLALLGVVIAPYFVDWTAYRADFEREASRILGRSVVVRGEASARLLPFPSVTFGDLVVGGAPGDTAPLMTIAGFRMDAELAPYLSGEIRIFSMRLDRPRLRVPVTATGGVAVFGNGAAPSTTATIVLEDVEIVDGTVVVENGLTGRVHEVSNIEARLSARSLAGPFAGSGHLTAAGERLPFSLSSGTATVESGLPLKLTLDSPVLDASLVLDGAIKIAAAMPAFEGTMRLTSPLPVSPPAPSAGGVPAVTTTAVSMAGILPALDLSATVAAGTKALDFSEIRAAVGGGEAPYILTGLGRLDLSRLPHFALDLKGEQVDVDEIAGSETSARGPITFETRLEAARTVFSAVPRPRIPGTVKLALPVVAIGDTTVRDVAFTVSPTDTGWSVERFAAELPGRTRMEATGVVGLDKALSFRGDLLVASRQPSGFAGWLTGSVDPAIRALPQAGFSATVDLSREAQRFEALEVDVGGETLKGRLERSGPSGKRRLAADLSAGKVDLDALLALSRLFTGQGDSIAKADLLALKIAAGPVSYSGIGAGRIDADLSYDGERLAISRLDLADLAGADLKMSGELADLSADVSGRMSLALASSAPQRVLAVLKERLPESPALDALVARGPSLGPLSLQGEVKTVEEASGERPTLRATFEGRAAGTDVGLSLVLGNGIYAKGESGRFGLDLTLSNETPSVLLAQLGLDAFPPGQGPIPAPAPLGLQLQLSAGASGPVAASAAMRAPGSEITAEGTFDIAAAGITGAEFGLTAKSRDAGPWLTATGAGLGQSIAETLPVDLGATLAFADGDLALRRFSGTIGGTEVAADLERHGTGPLSGDVFASRLSLPWLATLVYGQPPSGEGTNWPDAAFVSTLLPTLNAAIALTADRLMLPGGMEVADFSTVLATSDGSLAFSDIKGAMAGGYISGKAVLRNANGIGGFSLQAGLEGIDLGTVALIASGTNATDRSGDDGADMPEGSPSEPAPEDPLSGEPAATRREAGIAGTLDGTLTLDGTGQSYAAMVAALTGAGSLEITDASFAGVSRGLFVPILRAADVEGFVPGTETAARIVSTLSAGARYGVPSVKAEFAVAAGVARFPPTVFASPGERLTASGAIDLRDSSVSGDLRLDLVPGDEKVEGAEPSILYRLGGPLAAPKLVPDVQPLASYLAVRAFEREQARVEAMQEQLQERLRLRREARYYRWRAAERLSAAAISAANAEVERLRLERQRAADADAERQRAAAAEAEAMLAQQAAESARAAAVEQAERDQLARQAETEAAIRAQIEAARKADLARMQAAEERRKAEEAAQAARERQPSSAPAPLTPPARSLSPAPTPESRPLAPSTRPAQPSPARASPTRASPVQRSPAPASETPSTPRLDLESPAFRQRTPSPPPAGEFPSLPGVSNPLDF